MIVDYHNFSYPDATEEHCNKLRIGPYYINAVICKLCNWYIRSRNQHDTVTCRCGKATVDGGSQYLRRIGDYENMIEKSVLFDWAKEKN